MSERQQILHLWLHAAALDTAVVGWSFYDGTDGALELPEIDPPYATGVDALLNGWMLSREAPAARLRNQSTTHLISCDRGLDRTTTIERRSRHPALFRFPAPNWYHG